MPGGCTLLFEPFVATQEHEDTLVNVIAGNIYGQSTVAVDIGDGVCKRLLARPVPGESGDIVAMSCHCPDGSVITADPTWNAAGNVIWQEKSIGGIACDQFIVPQFLSITLPGAIQIARTASALPGGWWVGAADFGAAYQGVCGDSLDGRRTVVLDWRGGGCPPFKWALGPRGTNISGWEQSPTLYIDGVIDGDTAYLNDFQFSAMGAQAFLFGDPPPPPETCFVTPYPNVSNERIERWGGGESISITRNAQGLFDLRDIFRLCLDTSPSSTPFSMTTMCLDVSGGPATVFNDAPAVSSHVVAYIGLRYDGVDPTTGERFATPVDCCRESGHTVKKL